MELRRLVAAAFLPLLILIALLTATAAKEVLTPVCVSADEWVDQHRGQLPVTRKGLLSLPPAYRMRTFAPLPPVDRSRLFREHHRWFLQENPGLSDQQVNLIHELMALATSDLYRHKDGEHPGDPAAQEGLARRVADAFSRSELTQLAFLRAPQEVHYSSLTSLSARLKSGFSAILENLAQPVYAQMGGGNCDCHPSWSWWCDACWDSIPPCRPTRGCGLLWCERCTGVCV